MEYRSIQSPVTFFHRLGGLHDAEIQKFMWSDGVITVDVDDLLANFLGLPEYRGPRPASVRLSGIGEASVELDASASNRVTVYSWDVTEQAPSGHLNVVIRLAPGGLIRILCQVIEGDFDSAAMAVVG